MSQFSLSKQERLSHQKEIESLFSSGKSFNLHPIRVLYCKHSDQAVATHQVLFSVPAKKFKRAVDRNLIKRRLREAYRLNKSKLNSPVKLNVAYIYIANEILPFKAIEVKLVESFNHLIGWKTSTK